MKEMSNGRCWPGTAEGTGSTPRRFWREWRNTGARWDRHSCLSRLYNFLKSAIQRDSRHSRLLGCERVTDAKVGTDRNVCPTRHGRETLGADNSGGSAVGSDTGPG